ncbi:methylamine utilization protein [Marinomonas aquiplantarum]|uniref:Plastocyanin n=1 Tax=Marinomonas aquiplantarum TaxID=491951 RepID=A0A366D2S4_9GAMM|nr:methylamine utilization protein [Marinomonas aquiplantarum]RBO83734.1 plastocyanin [Marinomonas aquiplantarum]
MRYLLVGLCGLWLQAASAEITMQLLDQDQQPVTDAVVFVTGKAATGPMDSAVMDQIDESFVPRVLVVQKGQFVRFPNSDDIRHHVYSFSEPKSFEIKLYKGSDIEPIQFDKPGLVILGCNIHDDMIGYIFVADNEYAVKTNDQGWVTLPVEAGDSVSIWNERFVEGVNTIKRFDVGREARQTVTLDLYPPIEESDHSDHDYDYDW